MVDMIEIHLGLVNEDGAALDPNQSEFLRKKLLKFQKFF